MLIRVQVYIYLSWKVKKSSVLQSKAYCNRLKVSELQTYKKTI